jgi:adenylate kinase family enzyme
MPYPIRVCIYGVTGSGKTTLGRKLAAELGVPFLEVDSVTWAENWTEVPMEIQVERVKSFTEQDSWVIDTMYGKWSAEVIGRVEILVAFDYPRWRSLWQLTLRSLHRVTTKTPVCNGNIERWSKLLSHDSIIAWHFRSFKSKTTRAKKWESEGKTVIWIRHPRDLQGLANRIRAQSS